MKTIGVFKLFLLALLGVTLVACGVVGRNSPTPLPTVVLQGGAVPTQSAAQGSALGVTASGNVVPAQQAEMAFTLGGNVVAVDAAVGDKVQAGQVLVKLVGSEKLAAAVEAANLELLLAQQARDDLTNNLDADRNRALQAFNDARQAVRDAEKRVSNLGGVVDQTDIDLAHTQVIFARNDLEDAQDKFDRFANYPVDNLQRARAQVFLSDAQKKYDQALRNYNRLTGSPDTFDRQQAATDVEIAKNQLILAKNDYDKLQVGPDPALVSAAEERIRNAQAQLAASQAALADLELRAPFAGTVGKVNIYSGEWILPGESILTLANLDHLQVKTTDLSERDVPSVKIGQPVTVFVKALNQNVTGKVTQIAPLADTLGGDVVYQTTIDLDTQPEGLRAGMSVDVQFGTQ